MRRRERPIGEVDGAVADDDVVDGEARRLAGGSPARVSGEVLQHVVEVVATVADAGHAQDRSVDLEPIDHRREAEQRGDRDVGMNALRLEQRRSVGARAGTATSVTVSSSVHGWN